MAKVQLLAILSLDGCLSEINSESRWWLRPESYGITEIRNKATFELNVDTSLSMLINWKKTEDDTICYLIEATIETAELVNAMFRMRLIDEIVLYTIPFISGNGRYLFGSPLPISYWDFIKQQTFNGSISQTIFRRKKSSSG